MTTWRALEADPAMQEALSAADQPTSRAAIRDELAQQLAQPKPNLDGLQKKRKRWSEQFAKACATMVANELRTQPILQKRFVIKPDSKGLGQESFTPLGYKSGKRIDVVVSRPNVGLQLGISLKGLNFQDEGGGNFDKNLTGRLYELRDEVSVVHEYLPRAFMAALFFVPVASCFDKRTSQSSFAHVVAQLRSRTGRLDPAIAAHNWRADFGAVGIYGSGEPEEVQGGVPKGVVRYFPLLDNAGRPSMPPKRGLPILGATVSLRELVEQLLAVALRDTAASTHFSKVADESISLALPEATSRDKDEAEDEALDPI